jgi:alkanesulfonate monooxygenase
MYTFSWICPSYVNEQNNQYVSTYDVDFSYLVALAQSAEKFGFASMLIPIDSGCLDPFIVSAYVLQHTNKIRALIALRTGFIEPVYATRMVSTLSRLGDGRIDLNIVTGSSRLELEKEGQYLDHDARYRKTREMLEVSKGLMKSPQSFTYAGEFYAVKNASLTPVIEREPLIYVAGSSIAAKSIALDLGDVYMMFGEARLQVSQHIQEIKAMVEEKNNDSLRFGLRLNLLIRDTTEEAFAEITKLQAEKGQSNPRQLRLINIYSDSEGQKRMNNLAIGGTLYDECLYTGLIGGQTGNVPVLVGSPFDVREAIKKYIELGITHFIFSTPCKDFRIEAERVGEHIVSYLNDAAPQCI